MTTTEHSSEEEQQGAELAPKRRVMGREEFRRLLAEDQAQEQAERERLAKWFVEPPQEDRQRLLSMAVGLHLSPEQQPLPLGGITLGVADGVSVKDALEAVGIDAKAALAPITTVRQIHASAMRVFDSQFASLGAGMKSLMDSYTVSLAESMKGRHDAFAASFGQSMASQLASELSEIGKLYTAVQPKAELIDSLMANLSGLDTRALDATQNLLRQQDGLLRQLNWKLSSAYSTEQALLNMPTWIDGQVVITPPPATAVASAKLGNIETQPAVIEAVQIEESTLVHWVEQALRADKLSPQTTRTLYRLLQEHAGPGQHGQGQHPGDWATIEAAVRLYIEKGHNFDGQEAFATYLTRKGIACSLATFKRWLSTYEIETGERVRPGKGSRKRRKLS